MGAALAADGTRVVLLPDDDLGALRTFQTNTVYLVRFAGLVRDVQRAMEGPLTA
jgi:hypothetical protein